ncbi:hypothetical protein OsJ_33215 [Oryza sativa Japonica Group]|uniref:Aspartic proteinase Asp1 n=1 Tax=Oryza sativa subsp. japonica TaxID=39947 RepID=B9G9R6_ORYSJ|nr:hypothetical protein OsJ_33215 [Oryza sativa Japonica Group]
MVRADDPLYVALHEDGRSGDGNHMSPTQCDYEIKYADGASTIGALIVDQFSLPRIATRPNLPFGCGYNQGIGENFQQTSPVNGILGLDRGKVSFVSQLKMLGIITKHVVGHCLSSGGGGLLFVGDGDGNLVLLHANYYSPGSATLYFDRHSLGMNPMDVVFDSGSTYTYFTAQPYQATVYAIKGGLSSTSLEQVSDPSLPLCWKGQKAFESVFDVKKEFKSLQLNFGNNAVMEIPPENYLIVTEYGNVCLGILHGCRLNFNIIGDITMQDQMVIYDNEREQLGWIRGSCDGSQEAPTQAPSAEEVVGAAARREASQATGSYLAPPLCIGTDIIGCKVEHSDVLMHPNTHGSWGVTHDDRGVPHSEAIIHETPNRKVGTARQPSSPAPTGAAILCRGVGAPRHFFITMNIGDPAKSYFLDIDTGSTLTWLQCDAPCTNCNIVPHVLYKPTPKKLVTCADSLCTDLYTDLGKPKRCGSQKQCDYVIQYVDSSSMGVLVIDRFSLSASNGTNPTTIAFGCGYDQGKKNRNVPIPVDSILGLSRGKVTLLSQLKSQGVITKHVLGHCISSKGGGFLFFGDAQVPTSGVTWTPMNREHKYYSPGHGTLHFDSNSKAISAAPMAVIFDSGATYTYFAAQPYQATLSVVKSTLNSECKFLTEVTEKDRALTVCWKGKDKIVTIDEVKKCFRSLSLEFADGDKKATLEIPPEHYLIISQEGHVCLGILDGSKEHLSLAGTNLIGGITMLDQMVIYDSERSLLGWVNYQCDRIPRSESAITSRL